MELLKKNNCVLDFRITHSEEPQKKKSVPVYLAMCLGHRAVFIFRRRAMLMQDRLLMMLD